MSVHPAPARPSVVQLAIKEKAALYAAYMPLLANGGVFVATERDYRLGDDLYLLLTLPESPVRHPLLCKVAWITPEGVASGRKRGVGAHFPGDEKSNAVKEAIEAALGSHLSSERETRTI